MRLAVALVLLAGCGRFGFQTEPGDGGGDDGDGSVVVPGTTIMLSSTGSCPRVAWTGSHLGIVWREGTNFGAGSLWFAETDLDGAFSIAGFQMMARDNVECPAIVWTGTEYLIAVSSGLLNRRDIDTFRVSTTGTVSAPVNVVNDSGNSNAPLLAMGGDVVMLAWHDQTGTNYNAMARPLSLAGVGTQPPLTLSGIDADNGSPRIATTPSGFTVTWSAATPRLRNLDPGGAIVSPELAMSVAASGAIVAAWTGSDLIGGWTGGDQVGTVRFDLTGAPTANPTTIAADRAELPSLAWTGNVAAVIYLETYGTVQYHLARFATSGEYLGEAVAASASSSFAPPSLIYADGHFFAAMEANVGAIVRVIAP